MYIEKRERERDARKGREERCGENRKGGRTRGDRKREEEVVVAERISGGGTEEFIKNNIKNGRRERESIDKDRSRARSRGVIQKKISS